ncbi:unnamed protein product [Nyctereutes procyonoides]|uniref:(raccoon dog) hypothetical protein n=1 Tax=Nyctereutes procyonoides TaxID=34880 RepID=A0A811ZN87_NYCPR|nr:unnamed protein product [Nyctereutes procyonoides]
MLLQLKLQCLPCGRKPSDRWRFRRPCSLYTKTRVKRHTQPRRPSGTVSSWQRAAPWNPPSSGTRPRQEMLQNAGPRGPRRASGGGIRHAHPPAGPWVRVRVWAEYSLGEHELGRLSGPAKKNKAQFPQPRFHHHYEST